MKDYYQILRIQNTATIDEIKKSYRKLSIKFHPDKNPDDDYYTNLFLDIQEAYEVLSNSEKRRIYDQSRARANNYRTEERVENPTIEYFESNSKHITDSDNEIILKWSCKNAKSISIGSLQNLDSIGQKKIKLNRKNSDVDFVEVKLTCFGFQGQILEKTVVIRFKDTSPKQEFDSNKSKQESIQKRKFSFNTIHIFLIALLGMIGSIFLFNDSSSELEEAYLIPTDKSMEHSFIDHNLYRNKRYKFRIKFPQGWEILPGDGPNVVIKAQNQGNTISIIIKHLNIESSDLTIDDLYDSFEEYKLTSISDLREKFPKTEILEGKRIKIDNQPAYYVKYSTHYEAMNKSVDMVGANIQLFYHGIFYTISAGMLASNHNSIENIVNNSISTFVLEDFGY